MGERCVEQTPGDGVGDRLKASSSRVEPDIVLTVVFGDEGCSLSTPSVTSVGDIVRLDTDNEGSTEFASWLFFFDEGVTAPQIEETGPWGLTPYLQPVSGSSVDPGGSSSATAVVLEPGIWGVTCWDRMQFHLAGLFNVEP